MILPPPRNDEWLAIAVDIKPWAEAVQTPIAGVIGGNVWSQVPFSIDPASQMVTFFKRGPFPFSAGLQPEFLTRFDNLLKPAITANIDHGPERTFLLATGRRPSSCNRFVKTGENIDRLRSRDTEPENGRIKGRRRLFRREQRSPVGRNWAGSYRII